VILAAAFALASERVAPFARDADWIGGLYQMRAVEAPATPVPFDFDPAVAPDVHVLVPGVAFGVPLSGTATTLYLLTLGQGGLDATGVAADGEVRWADGRTQPLKWMMGEQIWPAWAGATGRDADVVPLGVNVGGDLLTASLLTVDLAWTDSPLRAVSITARPGTVTMALAGVTLSDRPPQTVQVEPDRSAPGRVAPWQVPPFPGNPPVAGPVQVSGGHLADATGRRLRLWGVNLVGKGNLPADPDAFAARLAALGFNFARLHHLDQEGVLPNPRRGEPGQPAALPERLDALDRTFAALSAHGIYSEIELMTLRSFRPGEGVPGAEGVALGNKYANQIWPEWLAAEQAWARAVWDRVNPYTGHRYADDPAVAMVELSNENSLVVGWSSGALEKLPKVHRDELDRQWAAWLRARYGTDARIAAAWGGSPHPGLQPGETLALDSIARQPDARNRVDAWPQARAADLVQFYQERERSHQRALARFVRQDLGFRVPLVCNTSFAVPAADALLDDCDVVDVHAYWDPIYESTVLTDLSLVESPIHGRILEELAWCHDGRPCILGELQHSYPNRSAHEAPLVWAALAARQDLDAVTWFAWSHDTPDPTSQGPAGALDLEGRFDALAQMPLAASLFRDATIPAAARRFVRWWSPDAILRDLAEQPGLWLSPQVSPQSVLDQVLRTSFAPRPAVLAAPPREPDPVTWGDVFAIDLPAVAAIVGRRGGGLRLSVDLDRPAAVWLADGVLTLVTHGERDGTLWPVGGPGPVTLGRGPYGFDRLSGTIRFAWEGRPRVTAPDGTRVAVMRRGGQWEITLSDAAPGRYTVGR
jgi:hypothetical protein